MLISCVVTAHLICDFVFAYMQKAGFLITQLKSRMLKQEQRGRQCKAALIRSEEDRSKYLLLSHELVDLAYFADKP